MQQKKSILIVDDEPAIAAALTTRLEASGYDVHHAPDGHGGLRAAASLQPDVILLDIGLPDIDGVEVHRRLKADAALARISVVFLTANVPSDAKQNGFDLGGSFYLSKPYEAEDVIRAVELVSSRPAVPQRA